MAVLLGCVFALSPAQAVAGTPDPTESLGEAGGLEYLRTTFQNVFTQAGPTTECDLGDLITGGGAAISGSGKTGHLNSSAPTNTGTGWVAEGRTLTSTARTVTGWAICGGFDTNQTGSTETLGPDGSLNSGLPCFNEEIALSAGADSSGGNVLPSGLFPTADKTWIVSIFNVGSTEASVRTAVMCAEVARKTRKSKASARSGKTLKLVAKCRDGEVVAGGGYNISRKGVWQHGIQPLATRPWDDKTEAGETPEDGWYVKFRNGTSKRVEATAYASCLFP